MKTLTLALLLCATTLFGQDISLLYAGNIKIERHTINNVVQYAPNESLIADGGYQVVPNINRFPKQGMRFQSIQVLKNGKNIPTLFVIIYTEKDTVYFDGSEESVTFPYPYDYKALRTQKAMSIRITTKENNLTGNFVYEIKNEDYFVRLFSQHNIN